MRKLTYDQIISVAGLSSRAAAKQLGVGKSTINDARAQLKAGELEPERGPRILTLDIESKPLTVYTWGLWDQNIGINQIADHGGMMCFAAKWLGSKEVLFFSEHQDGYDGMIAAVWNLLNQCDILITYNGDRYDIKRINNTFLLAGLTPPKPYKSIDLIKTNRNRFDLPSRKLDYLIQQTGVGAKVKHEGFDLWTGCMAGDPEAWAKMEEYNKGDVLVTEGAYLKLLPWLTNAPHLGMYTGVTDACPYCGKQALVASGLTHTNVQSYEAFKCSECGGWSRGTKSQGETTQARAIK